MVTIEVPPGYTPEQWTSYVKRGRHAVRLHSASNFELGDIDNEMLYDKPRPRGEIGRIRALFAKQVGIPVSTLRTYSSVARSWPTEKRRHDVPWTVHFVLSPRPDRFELILKEPSDELDPGNVGQWTVDAAHRATEARPKNPATARERIDEAKHLLRETTDAATAVAQLASRTEVMREAVKSSAFRRAVRAANRERAEQLEQEMRAKTPEPPRSPRQVKSAPEAKPLARPAPAHRDSPTAVLKILGQCSSFCVSMQSAVVLVQDEALTTQDEDAILDIIKRVRAICDWCEHVVTKGFVDMDDELARLLDGMGGDQP